MKIWFFLLISIFSLDATYAAAYVWGGSVVFVEGFQTGEIRYDLFGYIDKQSGKWVASANGQMFGYKDGGTLYLKKYDRKTTPVEDDNVTFVLAMYGQRIAADTLESATKLPLCVWDTYEHSAGLAIGDPSDFYLGFMTPESKTADGIPRYGWYHLSIADDLSDITLLDSGVGLYGEGVYVGIGAIPEPSGAMLFLLGLTALLLKRHCEAVSEIEDTDTHH